MELVGSSLVPQVLRNVNSKGRFHEKKLLFFWILSKLPPLPPSPPIWTTCTTFSNVEIQELKVSLGLHKDAIYIT